ncbi:ATP-binding protein [Streptomyces sp. NPDC093982]|uniref:ATP-binding protein n=1 Tax=Streptomyces sp. NPDC093982 TaxID=3155077 RepID=UPI00342C291D
MSQAGPLGEDGGADAGRFSLQSTVALEGDGTTIAQARHLAVDFLRRIQSEYGVAISQRCMELTQLVVSELVTNALKYAPGPVLMHLAVDGDVVEVVVWDSDPVLPVARAADAGRVGQHRLEIVRAIAESFGAQREPVGKRVTARIALAEQPSGARAGHRPE